MAAGTNLCTDRRDQLCRTGIKFEPVTPNSFSRGLGSAAMFAPYLTFFPQTCMFQREMQVETFLSLFFCLVLFLYESVWNQHPGKERMGVMKLLQLVREVNTSLSPWFFLPGSLVNMLTISPSLPLCSRTNPSQEHELAAAGQIAQSSDVLLHQID